VSESCTDCKLHHNRANIVKGSGRPYGPKLFLVGTAPTREDDTNGKPYSDGAGRILNSLLVNAGVTRGDVYVAFTCRCRPPNGRAPELDELLACTEHLRGEVAKADPTIIVALGDSAAGVLAGKRTFTHRGSIVEGIGAANGRKVLVTYEPQFVMRMRSMYPVVVQDLVKALNYSPVEVKEDYLVNPSREAITQWFQTYTKDQSYEIAVDIETNGDNDDEKKAALNPWGDTFSIIGISFTPMAGVALQLSGAAFEMSWDILDDFLRNYPKQIYQNGAFDRCAIAVRRGYVPPCSWDTLGGIHLINPALPKKLDFLRSIYTNIEPYKEAYRVNGKYQPGLLGTDALARLNCLDTDVTWRVAQAQKQFVEANMMTSLLDEDTIAIEMRVKGILVDKGRTAQHYARLLPTLDELRTKIMEDHGASISSPKQLKEVMYTKYGLPPHDDTGKSCMIANGSTNEKAIQAIASKLGLVYMNDEDGERFEGEHSNKQFLVDILEYRGLAKIASTYCEGVFKNLDNDGLLHPQWTTTVTDTGRWSCRGTPVQGYPKDMRDTIIARPGKVFLGADYKGMQILAAAIMAGDMELANNMLDPDYSLHNEVLEAIKPHYPSIKKIQAKTVVFGTFFGRTPRSIAMAFHVPVKTAELWQEIFYSTRPKLKALFEERLVNEWETKGYAEGIMGRRKYCEVVTEAKNHPVQNFESEVVKQALKELKAKDFTPVMMIHDQIVCEEDDGTPDQNEAKYQEFVHILEHVYPNLFHRFPVEGSWGYRWSEL
jgi:uracil-DNA glycosylase family 4